MYPHPSPFSTNIYWHEEMTLGPGPLKKGGKDKVSGTGSRRELTTGGQGSSMGSSADTTIVAEGGSPETDDSRFSREGWNTKRYQREDEILWGYDMGDSGGFDELNGNRRGSSIGLTGMSKSGKASTERYYLARNPAVNDLHPPVVSTQPTHKSETRWMLQPPPSAKIMEGKVRANRSRSGSGGSSRKGGEAMNLGRQVGERLIEEKVRRGKRPTTGEASSLSRDKSRDRNTMDGVRDRDGQPHDRNVRTSMESTESNASQRKKRPPPTMLSEDLRPSSASAVRIPLEMASSMSEPRLPPHGSTIQGPTSSSFAAPNLRSSQQNENTPMSPPPRAPSPFKTTSHHLRPLLTFTDSTNSLHILQELQVPQNSKLALNSRSNSPLPESQIKLPPSTTEEDTELIRLPECETWFPPRDFRFPGPWTGQQQQQRDAPEGRVVTGS